MRLVVNGRERDLKDHPTVASVVAELAPDARGRGLAVAVNGDVVPRAEWSSTELHEEDRVEVLSAIGGG